MMIVITRTAAGIMLLVLTVGCSTSTRGEKMVQGYARTVETVRTARASVDATLLAMHHVRTLPAHHLKTAFREYRDAIDRLEKNAASAKWRATSMKEQTDEHVWAWEKEMASIQDPAVKSSLESRRQAVRTNFALIQLYADDVRKAYEPFMRGCKDILQALSIDLSPAAVSSLAPAMDGVAGDGQALQLKLAAIQHALDNIAAGISPVGEMR